MALLETLSQPFRKARLVNCTDTTFDTLVPTTSLAGLMSSPPSLDAGTATGQAIIDLASFGALAQNGILVVPYGVGANNTTFSVRVYGWTVLATLKQATSVLSALPEWTPVNLLEVACTLTSSMPGAGGQLLTTEYFCDTLTVTTGSTLSGEAAAENIVSPANNTIGHFLVDARGFQYLELSFSTGSSATSCNALVKLL